MTQRRRGDAVDSLGRICSAQCTRRVLLRLAGGAQLHLEEPPVGLLGRDDLVALRGGRRFSENAAARLNLIHSKVRLD